MVEEAGVHVSSELFSSLGCWHVPSGASSATKYTGAPIKCYSSHDAEHISPPTSDYTYVVEMFTSTVYPVVEVAGTSIYWAASTKHKIVGLTL